MNETKTLDYVELINQKKQKKVIAFNCSSVGEVQFFRSVLEKLINVNPENTYFVFHHDDKELSAFFEIYPLLAGKVINLLSSVLSEPVFKKLDLYITTEQFSSGPEGVYTLTLFHGQPSKGPTFYFPGYDVLESNDALFLYGPLQRQALDEHLIIRNQLLPRHLSLFEIGYTKSDDLINGLFSRECILNELGLNINNKTILYAPAFNEGASMREFGEEIIRILCKTGYNILAKLAIDCLQPVTNQYATGGINWFEIIGKIEHEFPNFRLIRDISADKAMACSEIMITCISSIGFEFMAIGKPVIFIDTPRFYQTGLRSWFPDPQYTKGWDKRTVVNGGKELGLVVSSLGDLPAAISKVFANLEDYPPDKEKLRDYLLYNPGKATEVAVKKIVELLDARVRSSRPKKKKEKLILRVIKKLKSVAKLVILFFIKQLTRRININARGFINAEQTIQAAKSQGLSICEYLENKEDHPFKKGRRDRIISKIESGSGLKNLTRVCEIGAGTGRYLEKVIKIANPSFYEVYETDEGWRRFLKKEYDGVNNCKVICHKADGISLKNTASNSCELVHAHAVFVYIPFLITFDYIIECIRITKKGGHIVFDYFPSEEFSMDVINKWLASSHRFPVVFSRDSLIKFGQSQGLELLENFYEIYGPDQDEYMIWRKL